MKILCAAYDIKVGQYDPPFLARNEAEVLREWNYITKDPNTKFGKHPEDFQLRNIGSFNEDTGEIIPSNPPTMVVG